MVATTKKLLNISASPHVRTKLTVKSVMWNVVIALIPALVWAFVAFGIKSIIMVMVSVLVAVATEWLINIISHKKLTIGDGSAVLTGLLLGFNLPASSGVFPLYIPIIGSIFAIAVAKHAFGGLGQNWVNPALAGRVFIFFAWLSPMTSNWMVPFSHKANQVVDAVAKASADVVSAASPLKAMKFGVGEKFSNLDLFIGKVPGCIGEVSALALLIGGIYLIIRKIVNWEIPVAFIGSVALFGWVFGGLNISGVTPQLFIGDPLFHILSGGVMLGAFFMATDWVTSPITFKGRLLFGLGIGMLTILIRLAGQNVEGVSFAIILMNIVVPLINRFFKETKFGYAKKEAKN